MPEWVIPVAILITLLAVVIGGGIWVVWAFVRRTAGVSGPNIAFGLAMACATALLVFILVYLSAWAEMRQSIAMGDIGSSQLTSMRNDFVLIRRELFDYAHLHEHYPDSLGQVPSLKGNRFLDAWGHEYQYSKTATGYRLLSLGRDGKPGGIGLDADIVSDQENDPDVEPTLSQFLFEAAGSGTLFTMAILASFCAGLACFIASGPREVTARALLASIAVATVSAVAVALFLVSVYLAGEHH